MLVALLALVLCSCGAGVVPLVPPLRYADAPAQRCPSQDAPVRTTAPAVRGEISLPQLQPQVLSLPNGLTIWLVERHGFPIVAARLVVDTAALQADDVGGRRAHLVGKLFLSPDERLINTQGGCGRAACTVGSAGTSDELGAVLDRIASRVWGSLLPREVLEKRLATEASAYEQSGYLPQLALGRNVRALLFGSQHAYGESATTSRPTLDQVLFFRREAFVPRSSTLVLVGDVTAAAALAAATKSFGAWADARPIAGSPAPPELPQAPRIVAFHDPRYMQMLGTVAARGPAPGDPDAQTFRVLADLLGGAPSSGAFQRVREQLTAAYSVGASVDWYPEASSFTVGGSFERGKAIDGMKALLGAIASARDEPPDREALERAKRVAVARWRLSMSSAGGIASTLASAATLHLPPESVQEIPAQIRAVRPQDVQQAARRYLAAGALRIAFVGDPEYLVNVDALGFGWPTRTNAHGGKY